MGIAYLLELGAGEEWLRLLRRFEEILRDRLRGKLVRIIARSPDDLIYESNVAVVVKRADFETVREVNRAALDAMEETGLEGLSPITISEGDRIEEAFLSRLRERRISKEEWASLLRRFEEILRDRLGGRLVRIVARSPDDLIYESNVAVVVKRADFETVREVNRAALDAMEETGLEGLSPITISEGDRIEDEFEQG
ncbi:MAG: hypothetical protein ACP5KE_08905 [Candidatus Methanodesulfokora sp.]